MHNATETHSETETHSGTEMQSETGKPILDRVRQESIKLQIVTEERVVFTTKPLVGNI